ncbi:MAG: choice-of-anchor B domain-containing protein, partial [Patiriisocius sp.]
MKRAYIILGILLLLSMCHYAQVPCESGMAGIYPCCNYDLQSITPLDEIGVSNKSSDIWGWTDLETGKEYAIYCGNNGTSFIDVSDPLEPIYIGFLNAHSSESNWRDVKVYSNHAYIVSEAGGHGMQVFDLTRLGEVDISPAIFDEDNHMDDFGGAHNISINELTGFAYVIGADLYSGGPIFIDLADPVNPVIVGGYDGDGYTHDTQVVIYSGPDVEHQGKEIAFAFNENSLTIVDVTDKTDPTQLSRLEYIQSDYSHQGWLNLDQNIIFLGDETDELEFGFNTRTMIMDVSDLEDPFLIQEYFAETQATDHNMYVKDNLLYQSNNSSGLRVLEINEASDNILAEVGFFDSFPLNDDAGFTGTWSVYPYFESGNIILSARFGGLFIVKESEIENCPVGIEEISMQTFNISPNPSAGIFTIVALQSRMLSVEIFNIAGKLLMRQNDFNSTIVNLDLSNYSQGIYFLKIEDSSG